MEKITLEHLKWPLTIFFGLVAYIWLSQKDTIAENTTSIKQNSHAITVIQGNEKASEILINMLNERDKENQQNIDQIRKDLNKISVYIEANKK